MNNEIISYIQAVGPRSGIRDLKKDALEVTTGPNKPQRLFSLEKLLPTPLALLMDDFSFGGSDGYIINRLVTETGFSNLSDWRNLNWSVQEDITNVVERKNDTNYWMLKFTSVQTPPLEAIRQLSVRYPRIKFNIRYFGVDAMVAGERSYYQEQLYNRKLYQGAAYNDLITRLESRGVVICNEARRLTVKYNSRFKGRTVFDDFELVFGVTFD